ncbi:MAG: FtsX-like permease family protein [Candidatus Atribacteria bacterium]|nr:MAG: FtsX-like permease family protein [Candidatus Atribacteria bacterium]
MKHLKIIDYAISSLLRRRYKSLAIITAFTIVVTALASILLFSNSLKIEARYVLDSAPDLIVQKIVGGRHDLIPLEYADTIKKIPGVGAVAPRYWGYYYDPLTEANYTVQGTDANAKTLQLLDGRLPSGNDECAIGAGIAEIKKTGTGGELILVDSSNTGVLYEVVGVFRAKSSMLTNDLIILPNEAVIDFFGYPPGKATDIAVQIYNKNELQTAATKVKRLLPNSRPITKTELIRTYEMVFNWRSGMMLSVFSAALIAFCILAWDKATGISADEKQEIGILKAIGWDTSEVLALKFWEGFIIALTSFLLGTIAGYLHVFTFNAFFLAPVIKGWSVVFPDFHLTPLLDPYLVFTLGFLTITPYVASTVIPAWKTAITDPETIMRG